MNKFLLATIGITHTLALTCGVAEAATSTNTLWAKWHYRFVDGANGEDITWNGDGYTNAINARYQVACGSTTLNGTLSTLGHAVLNLPASTSCTFYLYTILSNAAGSYVYVQPPTDTDALSGTVLYLAYPFTSAAAGSSQSLTFQSTHLSPSFNIAAVAGLFMSKAGDFALPAGTTTHIINSASCLMDQSYFRGGTTKICIDTKYVGDGGAKDLSAYKFAIGHELGHRLADAVGMPIYMDNGYASTTTLCNCTNNDNALACYQSAEYSGFAQSEGFAWFTAAALFNSRLSGGGCGLGYWRNLYTTFYDPPPVAVNCAASPKWLMSKCPNDLIDTGTIQDWTSFFWNLWSNSSSYSTLSIAKITQVLSATAPYTFYYPCGVNTCEHTPGPAWNDLVATAARLQAEGQLTSNQYGQFVFQGIVAGVNTARTY